MGGVSVAEGCYQKWIQCNNFLKHAGGGEGGGGGEREETPSTLENHDHFVKY